MKIRKATQEAYIFDHVKADFEMVKGDIIPVSRLQLSKDQIKF